MTDLHSLFESLNNAHFDRKTESLFESAAKQKIPAVRRNTAAFLKMMATALRPESILEIGTGSAISTLCLASSAECRITTLERDRNRFLQASETLAVHPNVELLQTDAFQYLPDLPKETAYDLVFLDSQKRDYIDLLKLLLPRIRLHGALIADNIGFGGKLAQLTDDQQTKYASGVARLKDFIREIGASPYLDTFFIPIDDGISVSIRNGKPL